MGYLDSMNPQLREYLLKQKAERDALQNASAPTGLEALSNAFATVSSGFAGKDPSQAWQNNQNNFDVSKQKQMDQLKDNQLQELQGVQLGREEDKYQREQKEIAQDEDPNSPISKAYREQLRKINPRVVTESMSAKQVKDILAPSMKNYEIDQRALDRADAREQKNIELGIKKEEKLKPIEEKKKATLLEIEDRRSNIKDNLKLLKDQINNYGTYESTGPQNANMERMVDQVATDMAKLTDPNSVARPSEVDMFKKGLISPTLGTKNSTALQILDAFEKEVDKRADNAYRLRGIDNPVKSVAPSMDASSRQKRIQELRNKLGK